MRNATVCNRPHNIIIKYKIVIFNLTKKESKLRSHAIGLHRVWTNICEALSIFLFLFSLCHIVDMPLDFDSKWTNENT